MMEMGIIVTTFDSFNFGHSCQCCTTSIRKARAANPMKCRHWVYSVYIEMVLYHTPIKRKQNVLSALLNRNISLLHLNLN